MKKIIIEWADRAHSSIPKSVTDVIDVKIFEKNCTLILKNGSKIIVPFDNVLYFQIEEVSGDNK